MGRIPIGCVSLRDLAKDAGISKSTAIRYAKELGISGYISVGRSREIVDAMRRLYVASIEAKKERCRAGNRESKLGLVSYGEIASLAGCSWPTARRILKNLGWPSDIPRERASEAVAVIKETMAENARRHAAAAVKARWEASRKAEKGIKDDAKKAPKKGEKTAKTVRRTIKMIVKTDKKSVKPSKMEGKTADWSWRVAIRGDKGWLVVRTGTKEEMTAWADVLVDNGIMAEARKNKYGGMA